MAEPTTSNYSTSLDSDVSLGGDVLNFTTLTLDAGISAIETTISVAEDISAINVPCYLLIDSELIWATAKGSGDFTVCDRGAGSTTPASHLSAASVYLVYGANLFNQLKRAIIATQTAVGIASASAIQTGKLDFPTSTELTIASGSITPTQNWHTVDTESDAASDDLDTIVASGVTDGFVLIIRANHTDRSVVVKHNTGNIVTTGGTDITLDDTYKYTILVYDATLTKWIALSITAGSSFWTNVPGTPTRVSDTQFTITDTGGASNYASLFAKGMILKWDESGTFQTAMVQDAAYGANIVTINILGDSLTAGFASMKYAANKALRFEFIVPGALGAATDVARTHWPECNVYKLAVDARVKTAGTTNATVFDVNDDGTTIITTKPSIASTETSDLNNVCDAPSTVIAGGSAITCDIDSVSTTPPIEAYVDLWYYPAWWRYLS